MIRLRRVVCAAAVSANICPGLVPPYAFSQPAPTAVAQEGEPSLEALRAKAQERMRQDRSLFSDQEFREIETLYQQANRNLRTPEAKDLLKQVVQKYPKSNRAGCAVLYLAQMSAGTEREDYLKSAIAAHGEAWYGDGAQVGALARAQLATYYANAGRLDEAQKLAEEVSSQFPGAVDHSGSRLTDALRRMKLLRLP
jgi:TolA-binding protein